MELRSYGKRKDAEGEGRENAGMRVEAVYRAAERGGRWPRRRRWEVVVAVAAPAVVATWYRASERARRRESLGRGREKEGASERKRGDTSGQRERTGEEKRHIRDRRERERYLESETRDSGRKERGNA